MSRIIFTVFCVALTLLVSYLLGCFNGAVVISHFIIKDDVRSHGSGNAGLTNFYRTYGAKYALGVIALDMGKTVVAGLIGGYLFYFLRQDWTLGLLLAGVGCELGHMFPAFYGFKGGKGVLVGAVMLAFFDWRVFVIAFALFILSVVLTKWISLGSILGAVSFPITTWLFYRDPVLTAMAFGMAAAVVFMHRSNIGRILHGTENKFSFKSKKTIEASPDGEEK